MATTVQLLMRMSKKELIGGLLTLIPGDAGFNEISQGIGKTLGAVQDIELSLKNQRTWAKKNAKLEEIIKEKNSQIASLGRKIEDYKKRYSLDDGVVHIQSKPVSNNYLGQMIHNRNQDINLLRQAVSALKKRNNNLERLLKAKVLRYKQEGKLGQNLKPGAINVTHVREKE